MAKFAFIGTGNMGGALARAAARRLPPEDILLVNRTHAKAQALADELGCAAVSLRQAAAEAKYILLGVKPQMMRELLAELSPLLAGRWSACSSSEAAEDRCILVTMAAGLTMSQIAEMTESAQPGGIIRIMPNTPCAIGEGVILYDANSAVAREDLAEFTDTMSGAGLLDRLSEHLIDAGSAVAGCGPAFASLFLESLADGGVTCGLPRDKAMRYAAQMLKGAAALQLATGTHPGALKDAVCSPGGSTIAGVRILEERGFRGAVMDAAIAAAERSGELGK
ncbi:MAG: pyrroline-5-carboxylate reductase [Oscillospiraceae bacterium]|nr:pyrroline-5-carboxylate reductase [Oscillospiraceae bacterium]